MPCYWFPPGIRFQDYLFSEPAPLAAWRTPAVPGIAVVLSRDPKWGPKPLAPLCFADCANIPLNLHRDDLLVSVLPMPYSSPDQRRALCGELMAAQTTVSTSDLARKIDALDARQREQGEKIISLLTFLARFFEPQPVLPRNGIGFLTTLAPAQATETGS